MLLFIQCFLSPLLCGFRRGYHTQHALLRLVETCKKSLDGEGVAGAILMDLSKAFDSLNHELLIANYFQTMQTAFTAFSVGNCFQLMRNTKQEIAK